MKRTQNEKIMQIKNETLVVGIDIGKETHYARAFDYRGIEVAKLLRFANTTQGYEAFDEWLENTKQQNWKTEVMVGFEPTGHYWFTLGDHLRQKGHKMGVVNPIHVKRTRELDDNSPTKNDRKDPKTIAIMIKDGRFRDVYIPKNLYQELRESIYERERIQRQLVALSNQIIRLLNIRFPEFNAVFKNWRGKTAWATLRAFPTPVKVIAAGINRIMSKWQGQLKKPSRKKAEKLLMAATETVGRTAGAEAAEAALQNMLSQYEMLLQQRCALEILMQELLLRIQNAAKILQLKGIGILTAAIIVSEIGDISRFHNPRQILKMAGLNLRENSSGRHKGKTTIAKSGRKRLRKGYSTA